MTLDPTLALLVIARNPGLANHQLRDLGITAHWVSLRQLEEQGLIEWRERGLADGGWHLTAAGRRRAQT
jgi:hypothetical protein